MTGSLCADGCSGKRYTVYNSSFLPKKVCLIPVTPQEESEESCLPVFGVFVCLFVFI